MKTKFACALLAALVLVGGLVPSSAQAESTALEWEVISKPGDSGLLVVTPSEVSEIAVGQDDVIYALDIPNSKLYRSLDGGSNWTEMTSYLTDAGAGLPATLIAVAPDKAGVVAVVTDGGTKVYLSTDGGEEWTDTGVPSTITGTIQAIALSSALSDDDDVWEIAIGTAEWGDSTTTGQLWVRRSGGYPVEWVNQELTIDGLTEGGEVSTIAYSPDYENDATMLVVASSNGDIAGYENSTYLCLLERDSGDWNDITGYPVEISTSGDAPGVSGVESSLALPSDYSSSESESRQLFVSYDMETDNGDDVYRIDDATPHRLDIDGGSDVSISSIAYNGNLTSGTLLAGAAEATASGFNVQVWHTSEPWETPPAWEESSVPPTGPGNAQVAWSTDGETAYCGTGQIPGVALDESAFSASIDGDRWRQMGLIDTVIKIGDIVPTPDGESLFAVSYNEYGPEGIWRSTGDPLGERWERVLTMDCSYDGIILRLSQNYEDDSTLYAADSDGSLLAVSYTRGNSWQWCRYSPGDCPGGPMVDMVVADEETVYAALPDGYVAKTTSSGYKRWTLTDTELDEINMLLLVDEETIFVGGTNGDIAYSTDGGESFTVIDEVLSEGNGDVQVLADVNYAENGVIFAATDLPDEGIWRWVIDESSEWEQIDESITELGEGQCIGGLLMGSEGTLYALRLESASGTSGGVLRTLNPLEEDVDDIEFDLVNDDLPAGTAFDPNAVYSHTLPYLKMSANDEQNELWTVDTANHLIYRYQDTLCKLSTVLISPEDGEVLYIDDSDYIAYLVMCWEELAGAEEYEIVIYEDAEATDIEWSETSTSTAIIATDAADPPQLVRGTEYYWRVRVIEPIRSQWCTVQSFSASLEEELWSPMVDSDRMSPECGAGDISITPSFCWQSVDGATGYEFILARDGEFSDVVVAKTGDDALTTTNWECNVELDYDTTYFWKVRAVSEVSYTDWGTCLFTTEANPSATSPATETTTITTSTASIPSQIIMIVAGVIAALIISLVVLIVRTR